MAKHNHTNNKQNSELSYSSKEKSCFCSLRSIANTRLTPESPTRWEGSRISTAKSNSSFLVSTFPGVEEKTGNFSCSLFGGSQSGDVDLICAVSGSPEVRVHVMKARAGM